MDLIRQLEQTALALRDHPPTGELTPLDEPAPRIGLAMERPLYTPAAKTQIEVDVADDEVVDPASLEALYSTTHVDKARLQQTIRRLLQSHNQVSLEELIQSEPLEQGLAELIAYLGLAADDTHTLIDEGRRVAVSWIDGSGAARRAFMPSVLFKRAATAIEAAD